MWRYVAGGVAALLMAAVGWLLFRSEARPDVVLPARPPSLSTRPAKAEAEMRAMLPEAPERSREQKRFDRYDKDRNASVTREEFLVARRKAFAKLDVNGDGRLTFDEWAAKTTQRFATADADRSGALTAAEFAATRPKRSATRPRCACRQPTDTSDD